MSLNLAIPDMSQTSLIEAIYRASRMVTHTGYDFDNEDTRPSHLSAKERKQIAKVVAEIVEDIERASNTSISDLPAKQRAEMLRKLYAYLEKHVATPHANEISDKELLADLHSAD